MNRVVVLGFLCIGLLLVRCSDSPGPTDSTPLSKEPSGASFAVGSSASQNATEEFNCTNVQEVYVRFGDPGWVRDNVVGLFVKFVGVPDRNRTLRIWWDSAGAPGSFEDVALEDADVSRNGDRIDIEKIVEHTYRQLEGETKRRVRVELILADQTGNCARVRDVTVNPPPVTQNPATKICATSAEGGTVNLMCPAGTKMTAIQFASYGTPNGTCGSFTMGACHASSSNSIVATACVGKASCSVGANNAVFGDPCIGTVKRLYVQATCQ